MKKIFTLIAMAVMALSASAQNTYGIYMDETTLGGTLMGVTEEAIGFTPGVTTAGDVKVTYTNGKDTKYIAELEKTFGANFFLLGNFNNGSFQYRPYIANGSVNATWSLMDGGVLVCTGFKNGTDENAAGFIGSDADAASRWPENENNDETQPKIDYFKKNLYEIAPDYWTGMTIEVPAGQALNVDEISVAIGGGNAFYWSVAIFNEAGEMLYDSKVAQAQNNFNSTDAGKQGNICGFSADITAAGVAEPLAGYNFMPKSWHSSAGYFDNFIGETALPITLEKADKMAAAGWDPTNKKSPVRKFQPLPAGLKLTGKNTVRVYFCYKNSRLFGLPYLYVKGSLEEYVEFESNGIYYDIINDTSCEVQVISGNNKYSGNITIPEKVTHNGKEYSVKSIASYAFSRSYGLNSVTIPNSVNSIGDYAFYGCSSLTGLNIPESVSCIGNYVFYGCSGLTSMTIPNSVRSIGDSAFYGCSGLSSINIPNSVISIGDSAFEGCTGELRVNCNIWSLVNSDHSVFYHTKFSSVVLGEYVTNIGDSAFYGCSSLTSVIIPNSVGSIGDSAFYGCSSLTSVNIPNSVGSIGDSVFYGCSSLTSVIIPNSVRSIGNSAFYGCSGLTSINVPNSVRSIGNSAFHSCSGLTSINVPNSVIRIGNGAFQKCSALRSMCIEDGETQLEYSDIFLNTLDSLYLGRNLASNTSYFNSERNNLSILAIGKNVVSLDDKMFYYCNNITKIICYAIQPPVLYPLTFITDIYNKATLSVPSESMDKYRSADIWKKFMKIEEIDNNPDASYQCATPVIAYADGKLQFSCETEGAECKYTLINNDVQTMFVTANNNSVELTACYDITAYAVADGYKNSEKVSAMLYWIKGGDISTNINTTEMRGVMAQCNNGIVTVSGLFEGENVQFYTITGVLLHSAIAQYNKVSYATDTNNSVLIVKIGDTSIKVSVQ